MEQWRPAGLGGWIERAAEALWSLWAPQFNCFYRDSIGASMAGAELSSVTGAMTSNHCFLAAAEYAAYASDRREVTKNSTTAREVLASMWGAYYTSEDLRYRTHSGSTPNGITDSYALTALATCRSRSLVAMAGMPIEETERRISLLDKRIRELSGQVAATNLDPASLLPGRNGTASLRHMMAVRSIDAVAKTYGAIQAAPGTQGGAPYMFLSELVLDENARLLGTDRTSTSAPHLRAWTSIARSEARDAVLRQLGLHSGGDPEFDAGSLVAALATLQRFGGRSGNRLIGRGLEVLKETQDRDGSWRADMQLLPCGRLVYVSSLRIANIIADILFADLVRGEYGRLEVAMTALSKAYNFVEASFIDSTFARGQGQPSNMRGWGNDRTGQTHAVEAWPTALALQLLLRLSRIVHHLEQRDLLTQFTVASYGEIPSRWPDLDGILPARRDSDAYISGQIAELQDRWTDPTGGPIADEISENIVGAILRSESRRPVDIASFLLYGPPGSRKTSLIHALARALGWPVVTIAPPDFLIRGIEMFEARADEIFDSLTRLSRVVVLFDECEELFRRRLPIGSPETRTGGAFITSGMLPRLQELRNREQVLFAIATNTDLDDLDPAVVRRGRLDRHYEIDHPVVAVQTSYLIQKLNGLRRTPCRAASISAAGEVLELYETLVVAPMRAEHIAKRRRAREKKAQGNVRAYIDELAGVRAAEAELPVVSFQVLDAMAERLSSSRIGRAPLRAALEATLEPPAGWDKQ
ncbi:MAG TPA: ATP-binding protein [Iamia sp.]|nr:ATP-binding protein [Iamia sp.]